MVCSGHSGVTKSSCFPGLLAQSGPPYNLLLERLGGENQPHTFCKDDTNHFKK